METKFERYNRNEVSASELAEKLAAEGREGWTVVSADYEGDDFVVEVEKEACIQNDPLPHEAGDFLW